MTYPRELRGTGISLEIKRMVHELAARLLAGSTPVHVQLRNQLAASEIEVVTLTGAGLYAEFSVHADASPVEPPEMIGGEVLIEVEGLDAPAGSLIKIKNGRLAFVEVYTFGHVGWPDHPRVLSYGRSMPLSILE
jgi:hypothetical protein